MSELREKSTRLRAEVEQLRKAVKEKRRQLLDTNLAQHAASQKEPAVRIPGKELLKCCRHLQGHTGKVYSLSWARGKDVNKVVSASQDGRLIVWNALSSQKLHAVKLVCQWVMACAFSPGGTEVVCGGLDNMVSIFRLSASPDKEGNLPVERTLVGHKGYISCCKYGPSDDSKLLTSSGDQTCALWDTRAAKRISSFGGSFDSGHSSDVMSLAVNPVRTNEFVSGSCDATAKVWDVRTPARCSMTLQGHTQDVNAVQFLRDGYTVGSGSDDGTCRLFDVRTGHELQVFDVGTVSTTHAPISRSARGMAAGPATVTSIEFSHSGRLLFVGYSDTRCVIWDTLLNQVAGQLGGHTERVSCLGMAADGSALCSGSWDKSLRIWTVPQLP